MSWYLQLLNPNGVHVKGKELVVVLLSMVSDFKNDFVRIM